MAVVGAIALTLPATAAFAATESDDPTSSFATSPSRGTIDSSFESMVVGSDGHTNVIVELSGDPVAVVEADSDGDLTQAERDAIRGDLEQSQQPIAETVESLGGDVQAQMQSAYNGMQVSVPAEAIDTLADLPGVVAIHPATTFTQDNATSVPFLGVPQVWEDTGYTGAGTKIAIIDSGIDYTHADFGGPGTVAAFEKAAGTSTEPADPALFGPDAPRVKGGIDLVGDDYDAGGSATSRVPVPDDNPLDCGGHGTHVAGTAAGSGVLLSSGSTFEGPYDSETASHDFIVGPGVAPEADLYAVRVFGCDGTTDVVVPAIDWAVENGMDVINMSLGSTFGRADTPEAIAATNAVGAGVVVVASAGNAGPSPYITGSPGTGEGVISVSAVDSSPSFPGVQISVDGTN
ncbi:S8 family serine peptidase, partial [Microbacterium sp.]|uniref:S8 family serine peptidase n=1 Tax=Microbacterium sp. TaxID=51671 RepID=UPI003A8A0D5F